MSFYKKVATIGGKFIPLHILLKYGFNLSPMYRRTTAKIISVAADLMCITIIIKRSYRNTNYVNTIFGGSMFAAIDPIPMTQLINLLGDAYVVWDKSAEVFFKRPATENLFATFQFDRKELDEIKNRVKRDGEIEIIKTIALTSKDQQVTFVRFTKPFI